MTLETRLIAVNQVQRGDRIGYGGTYVCGQSMPVGVAAIGYGDGYPRHAPSGTPVLVEGVRCPLVDSRGQEGRRAEGTRDRHEQNHRSASENGPGLARDSE